MIHKNAFYGSTSNVTVAEFNGDILILNSKKTEVNSVHVVFQSDETTHKPNTKVEIGGIYPEIVFMFRKPESIDALINKLLEARSELTK
jgi:hypothetical protein